MSATTKDRAASMRARLKREKGWSSRDVSIRTEYFSMGSSVHATIRNARAVTHQVEAILKEECESIRRCEMSGEILSGGNTYVHVGHSDEVKRVLARRHADTLADALARLGKNGPGSSILEPIHGCEPETFLGSESNTDARFWIAGRAGLNFWIGSGFNLEDAAFHLALALEEASAR